MKNEGPLASSRKEFSRSSLFPLFKESRVHMKKINALANHSDPVVKVKVLKVLTELWLGVCPKQYQDNSFRLHLGTIHLVNSLFFTGLYSIKILYYFQLLFCNNEYHRSTVMLVVMVGLGLDHFKDAKWTLELVHRKHLLIPSYFLAWDIFTLYLNWQQTNHESLTHLYWFRFVNLRLVFHQ